MIRFPLHMGSRLPEGASIQGEAVTSTGDGVAKLLLKPLVLVPYRLARRAGDSLIRRDFKGFHEREAAELKELLGEVDSVLDVGSGYGYLGDALHEVMPNAHVVNTDVIDNHQGSTEFIQSDGASLPFKDNSFDAVTLFYVLHHTQQPREVLREARRVSRRSVIVQEDAPKNVFERLVSWFHVYTWESEWPLSEITVRRDSEWQQLFQEEGFSVKGRRTIRMIGLPITRYQYTLEKNLTN